MGRLEPYRTRARLVRATSDSAAPKIRDESLDIVFIDGAHNYEHVLNDLRHYRSKLRHGGILAGHDYPLYGVSAAVHKVFAEFKGAGNILHVASDIVFFW